jgi:hypothetical protein
VALIELVTALFALAGPQLTVQHVPGAVRFTDLYGTERHAPAALECRRGGEPVLYLSPGVHIETLAHELAHAYDCADDGKLNGSPIRGLRPLERPAWASDYCWNTVAEWYACWVVRSGSPNASPLTNLLVAGPTPAAVPVAAAPAPVPTPTPIPSATASAPPPPPPPIVNGNTLPAPTATPASPPVAPAQSKAGPASKPMAIAQGTFRLFRPLAVAFSLRPGVPRLARR